MKRLILAGRDSNKNYKSIRFSGWTKTKDNIIEQANMIVNSGLTKRNSDELKRYVRYAISEAEAASNKLTEYCKLLEKFNSSNATLADISTLAQDLDGLTFKQDH